MLTALPLHGTLWLHSFGFHVAGGALTPKSDPSKTRCNRQTRVQPL